MGSLPNTKLLLINGVAVIGEFQNYAQIAVYLGISVDNKGVVTFMGEQVEPSYSYGEEAYATASSIRGVWKTKQDIISDWAKCYMSSNLPPNYKIYRFLTNG